MNIRRYTIMMGWILCAVCAPGSAEPEQGGVSADAMVAPALEPVPVTPTDTPIETPEAAVPSETPEAAAPAAAPDPAVQETAVTGSSAASEPTSPSPESAAVAPAAMPSETPESAAPAAPDPAVQETAVTDSSVATEPTSPSPNSAAVVPAAVPSETPEAAAPAAVAAPDPAVHETAVTDSSAASEPTSPSPDSAAVAPAAELSQAVAVSSAAESQTPIVAGGEAVQPSYISPVSSAPPAQVEPAPAAAVTTQALAPPSAVIGTGLSRRVTLDLKDMDIVEVVKMLAKQNNINLVLDNNVSGRVTLLLNNVEFWEAFKAILSSRDLAYAREGSLVTVMTAQDYERWYGVPFAKRTQRMTVALRHARAKIAKDMLDQVKTKVGTIAIDEVTNSLIIDEAPETAAQMKVLLAAFDVPKDPYIIRLNYAAVEDLEPKLSPFINKESGSLQIDKRSNSLIIQDNPARTRQIAEIVKAFDVRHKCVLIEAKIMQVILNKSFKAGVNWQGVNWNYILDRLHGYHLAGSLVQNLQLVPAASLTPGNVTAPGITASVGVLEKPDFRFVMNMLSSIGTTRLLSSPRVMALNNNEAKIHVGSKAAKITKTVLNVGSTTSNPVTTENVEFLDTGVKLSVTPSIGDDGMITMKVRPEVSSVENTIITSEGSSIPIIRVSEAEASLVVKDGVTIVIGGLMEDSRAKTDTEVPWIGRIPLIGYLFRSRQKEDQKTELVIFLTPRIINGESVPLEVQDRLDLQSDGSPKKKGFFRRLFGKKSHV